MKIVTSHIRVGYAEDHHKTSSQYDNHVQVEGNVSVRRKYDEGAVKTRVHLVICIAFTHFFQKIDIPHYNQIDESMNLDSIEI